MRAASPTHHLRPAKSLDQARHFRSQEIFDALTGNVAVEPDVIVALRDRVDVCAGLEADDFLTIGWGGLVVLESLAARSAL